MNSDSAVPGLNRNNAHSLEILLPPVHEQRAIAEILDSIDVRIESAEAVIAASEQMRDSLLHELLTRGMPGWHTEWREVPGIGTIPAPWVVVRLGDVAEVAFSSVDKKTIDGETQVRLCNYTDVYYNRRITSNMALMFATANTAERERWSLKQGDVLFTKDSETADDIGVPAVVTGDMPGVLCGYHLGLARPHSGFVEGGFLAEIMGSRPMASRFSRIANGVTRFGLTLDSTRRLQLPLPSLAEQGAIVELLDSTDMAIENRRVELESLHLVKASTADNLLTGRVRVGKEDHGYSK